MNEVQDPPGEITPEMEARARAIIEKGLEDGIDRFYELVRADDLIGPIFISTVHDWDGHKRTMVDFWSRAVLGTQRYNGMPLPPHVRLGLKPDHFHRWLALWKSACAQTMAPPLAEHVGAIAANMSSHWSKALESIEDQVAQFEARPGKGSELKL